LGEGGLRWVPALPARGSLPPPEEHRRAITDAPPHPDPVPCLERDHRQSVVRPVSHVRAYPGQRLERLERTVPRGVPRCSSRR
jgi:hypothetical protein